MATNNSPLSLPKKPTTLQTTTKIPDLDKISRDVKNKVAEKPEVVVLDSPVQEASTITDHGFSQEQLVTVWKQYVEKLRSEEKSAELSVINQHYEIKDDENIVIKLSNPLQVDIFERFRLEFVNFLRTNLNNNRIKVSIEIVPEEVKQRLYTSQDKFNYMAQKNPKLLELKQRLGLEYDY